MRTRVCKRDLRGSDRKLADLLAAATSEYVRMAGRKPEVLVVPSPPWKNATERVIEDYGFKLTVRQDRRVAARHLYLMLNEDLKDVDTRTDDR